MKSLIKETKTLDGLIIYSINLLPENKSERKYFLNSFLKQKKKIHFALEEIALDNKNKIREIEDIYFVKENSKVI